MRDVRLVPTPLADVGPLGFDPPWRAELTSEQDAADWWRSQPVMPVCGEVIERGGVRLQPVSFCTWEPTGQVMVHLNSLTDAHGTDIRPALLEPVAGSALRVRSYLLPADGRYTYRFLRRSQLAVDLGRERSDWVAVHTDARADPLNPVRLPGAFGPDGSVWVGPDAPAFPEPCAPTRWRTAVMGDGRELAWHGASAATHTLVLFDGERWRTFDPRRLAGLDRMNLVLIPSGSFAERERDLTDPERAAGLVAGAGAGAAR